MMGIEPRHVRCGTILWLLTEKEILKAFWGRVPGDLIPVVNLSTGLAAETGIFGHFFVALSEAGPDLKIPAVMVSHILYSTSLIRQ